MMKYFYIIGYDEHLSQNLLAIVSEEDFNEGFNASYEVPEKITNYLNKIGCPELVEGTYEIKNDINHIRKKLNRYGLEERQMIA